MRTVHTLHLNLKVCVARSGRVCSVATHAVGRNVGYGLLDVIKIADYIVDLRSEGGDGGGMIIACGSPEQVAEVKGSYTGAYLKLILK